MKTFKILIISLILINLFSIISFAYGLDEENSDGFKVIGYYSGDLFNEPTENLQTAKLTHVIYAFLIPKEDGSLVELSKPEQLEEIVSKAHNDGTKVFIALGGWSYEGKPLEPVFREVAMLICLKN